MLCGVPLYYCSPGFRVLGIVFGTIGLLIIVEVSLLLIIGTSVGGGQGVNNLPVKHLILIAALGIAFLCLCRILIRRGSI